MPIDVEALYRRYGPMVMRRCKQMLRDEEQAAELMQDVFVAIVRRRDDLDDRGVSSLLYRTATNLCLNRIRTARRRPSEPSTELLHQIASATNEADRSVARSVLTKLLGAEPPSTALIATLHFHDGMTLEETAREVGLSVSGVRKRLRKLRASLRALEAGT